MPLSQIATCRRIKPNAQCFVILYTIVLYVDTIVLVVTQKEELHLVHVDKSSCEGQSTTLSIGPNFFLNG